MVAPELRFKRYGNNCPICGGHAGLKQGRGTRCAGYLSDDGEYVFCTREEYAGNLTVNENASPPAFCHKLYGYCNCGIRHNPAKSGSTYRKDRQPKRGSNQPQNTCEFSYLDEHGRLAYVTVRHEYTDGRKDFMQKRPDGQNGSWIYNLQGVVRIPYRLPDLLKAGPGSTVYICEGEKAADAARHFGLTATTNVCGANNWTESLNSYFKDFHVVILPDNDDIGRKHAQTVSRALTNYAASVKIVSLPGLPSKGDIVEWIAQGGTKEQLEKLSELSDPVELGHEDVMRAGAEEKESQATILRRLALEQAELLSSPDGGFYARIKHNGHLETLEINERSGAFKRWLMYQYSERLGGIPNSTALSTAIASLEAEAQFGQHAMLEVHLRIASSNNKLYLDLGQGEVVEIDGDGWRIIPQSPVCFWQPGGMLPLPHPVPGGSVQEIREFINVREDSDWILVLSWLLACFHPDGPYPVLVINGEHGSAKSTTTKLLRKLFDPAHAEIRRAPDDNRTLAVMAHNSRVLAFDNMSFMPGWLSDALARLSTGDGDAYRSHYTNAEETIFKAKRPIIMNGIEDIITREDLLSRSLIINLPPIEPKDRQAEQTFWAKVEEARPRILGALLDVVSVAWRNLPTVQLTEMPRMADFYKWIVACESTFTTPGKFMRVYETNRTQASVISLEASPLASALQVFMHVYEQKTGSCQWTGSATALLTALKPCVEDTITKTRDWPKNPRALSGRLRRLASNLRQVGLHMIQSHDMHGSVIIITKLDAQPSIPAADGATYDANDGHDANMTQMKNTCVMSASGFGSGSDNTHDATDANFPNFFLPDEDRADGASADSKHGHIPARKNSQNLCQLRHLRQDEPTDCPEGMTQPMTQMKTKNFASYFAPENQPRGGTDYSEEKRTEPGVQPIPGRRYTYLGQEVTCMSAARISADFKRSWGAPLHLRADQFWMLAEIGDDTKK